ncbi:MAG: endonuclease/exonuclease/phosphatase family protein [Paracoccaceae bacterium]|nr:endonuclease/exonuclease/phosphatase family protein [Paracoccaceae bacterium]
MRQDLADGAGVRSTVSKFMRRLVLVFRVLTFVVLFLAVFSYLHPIGESFSVIQFPLAGFGLLLSAFRHNWVVRLPLLVVSILALGQVGQAYRNLNIAGDVTVYQKNLLHLNDSTPRVLRDIKQVSPDVLTVQELTNKAQLEWQNALTGYATLQFCPNKWGYGAAVISKWQTISGSGFCQFNGRLAGIKVQSASGPLWLVSLHLHWPWPYEQAWQVPEIVETLKRLDGPIVVGGDFNNLPWSGAVNDISEAARGRRAGGVEATFVYSGIPLAIDNVIAPSGGVVETRPKFSSDHLGLVAKVGISPRP